MSLFRPCVCVCALFFSMGKRNLSGAFFRLERGKVSMYICIWPTRRQWLCIQFTNVRKHIEQLFNTFSVKTRGLVTLFHLFFSTLFLSCSLSWYDMWCWCNVRVFLVVLHYTQRFSIEREKSTFVFAQKKRPKKNKQMRREESWASKFHESQLARNDCWVQVTTNKQTTKRKKIDNWQVHETAHCAIECVFERERKTNKFRKPSKLNGCVMTVAEKK